MDKGDFKIGLTMIIVILFGWLLVYVAKTFEKDEDLFVLEVNCEYICEDKLGSFPVELEEEPSLKNQIIEEIDKINFMYPSIIKAQAQLESGFNSSLLKDNNNPWGMTHPGKRETTSKGSNRGFAVFGSISCATLDRKYWDNMIFGESRVSKEEYLRVIARSYFGNDPEAKPEEYIKTVLNIAKDYE